MNEILLAGVDVHPMIYWHVWCNCDVGGLKIIIIKKYILLILNPNLNPNSNLGIQNSNLGIQTLEFQILHCLKRPKQKILKSMNFKSRHFKSMNFKFKSKSKSCHPNTTYKNFDYM